ncbi:carbohydrate ABC transporter permease [Salibacterium aidingense]|uniref:carbohydrate ABC transporter permease n=1 Tax=Salibacterium aidingense TaxID=384933 RepID=UPI00041CDD1F|nr:sugar ABC transporter permease [Salibacterium aidingense]
MNTMNNKMYSYYFLLPAAIIYFLFFLFPTLMSFFYSFTWWTLTDWEFIGFENFINFFQEPSLRIGFRNTLFFAVTATTGKVVLGLLFAVFLCSKIRNRGLLRSIVFFPVLISAIAIGIAFSVMMHPTDGIINSNLAKIGLNGPNWLGEPSLAIFSVAFTDIWRGVGIATVIFIAGIMAIPWEYREALKIDGGSSFQEFWHITLPLSRPAMNTVIILALIDGLRNFDLVWAMTGGGPGFSSDVLASIIYKQYAGGFYGLATAGNVILFLFIALIAFPVFKFINRREVDL